MKGFQDVLDYVHFVKHTPAGLITNQVLEKRQYQSDSKKFFTDISFRTEIQRQAAEQWLGNDQKGQKATGVQTEKYCRYEI